MFFTQKNKPAASLLNIISSSAIKNGVISLTPTRCTAGLFAISSSPMGRKECLHSSQEVTQRFEQIYRDAKAKLRRGLSFQEACRNVVEEVRGNHHFYIAPVEHNQPEGLEMVRWFSEIALQRPHECVFVTEEFDLPDSRNRRMVSLETAYPEQYCFYWLAQLLKIPIEEVVVRQYQFLAVQKAIMRGRIVGFSKEELFQAMLCSLYPLTKLKEKSDVVEFAGLTAETIKSLAMRWKVSSKMLQQYRVLAVQRYRLEEKSDLMRLSVIIQQLLDAGNEITRARMEDLMRRYPDRTNVFVLAGSLHLPAFQSSDFLPDNWVVLEQEMISSHEGRNIFTRLPSPPWINSKGGKYLSKGPSSNVLFGTSGDSGTGEMISVSGIQDDGWLYTFYKYSRSMISS